MEWISKKDRLPEKGQNVICAAKMDGETWWFGCCKYTGFFPWVRMDNPDPVEFWMALLEPPNVELRGCAAFAQSLSNAGLGGIVEPTDA